MQDVHFGQQTAGILAALQVEDEALQLRVVIGLRKVGISSQTGDVELLFDSGFCVLALLVRWDLSDDLTGR